MLHCAGGCHTGGTARMGHTDLDRDVLDWRHMHERDVAAVVELDESVLGTGYAVHPIQRLEFSAQDVGEEVQLRLEVRS